MSKEVEGSRMVGRDGIEVVRLCLTAKNAKAVAQGTQGLRFFCAYFIIHNYLCGKI